MILFGIENFLFQGSNSKPEETGNVAETPAKRPNPSQLGSEPNGTAFSTFPYPITDFNSIIAYIYSLFDFDEKIHNHKSICCLFYCVLFYLKILVELVTTNLGKVDIYNVALYAFLCSLLLNETRT